MADAPTPLLRVRPSDVAARALVVGDPARAEAAATRLDDAREVGRNREYATFTGRFAGTPVTVASHGIGAAGAAICFEELARAGARALIRAGTCGALRDDLDDGALVVATGAVRAEGLTPKLVPLGYPALADHRVVAALLAAAADAGAPGAVAGVVLTEDRFYPSAALPQDWRPWQESRVLAVEMETAALLVIAALHGIPAGAVLTVDGNPTRAKADMSGYDPHREVVARGVETMLGVAFEALVTLDVEIPPARAPDDA